MDQVIDTFAHILQAHLREQEDVEYPIAHVRNALIFWLDSSKEQLLAEALFHLATGTEPYAFNRNAFRVRLRHLEETRLSLLQCQVFKASLTPSNSTPERAG
jgi:hypothetical protein